jgi:choice-of-anchor C domain-containing protein
MTSRPAHALSSSILSVAVLLALSAAAPARANLLVNPGFESGTNPGVPGSVILANGSTAITGWTVTDSNVEYVGTLWQPADGARSVGLLGTELGSLAQTVATTPGGVYLLSFKMSGEPFANPAIVWLRVQAAGQSADFSFDTTPCWHWDMFWSRRTWTFTANAATTTLEFTSLYTGEPDHFGPAIDSLSLTQTGPVGVEGGGAQELTLALLGSNPLRGPGQVAFVLPRAGHADLYVADVTGRRVASLASGVLEAGRHERSWGTAQMPAGLYFITLRTQGRTLVRRVTLLR